MQRTPRQCTLRSNGADSSDGPTSSSKIDRLSKINPYMRKESRLTFENLNKALKDVKEAMKVFKGLREAHHLGDQHFAELDNNYQQLVASAQTGKTQKNLFLMKKTTATLEIMLFNLKKGNKEFGRRYKKLIAQAKAEREGRAIEEADDDDEEEEAGEDEHTDNFYEMEEQYN